MRFQQLEKAFGSDAAIAEALGVSRQLVGWWRRKGISPQRQAWIELMTGGSVTADLQKRTKART